MHGFVRLLLVSVFLGSCSTSPFVFNVNNEGISLSEKGDPVFFYQRKPKSLTGEYICNNYLHPLYDLEGDTLTEEFPADHLFHRGVFWAWHQLYAGGRSLGDGWMNQGISYEVTGAETSAGRNRAQLNLKVSWRSDSLENRGVFITESTTIKVSRQENDSRAIDFEIVLSPAIDSLSIGGSDDEKGYGGFCVRLRMPDGLQFTSEGGKVEPQNLQVKAGTWMDFSADFNNDGKKSGVVIVADPSNPGEPGMWILRQKGSMQNAVFPGRQRYLLDKPLILRYRLKIYSR